MTTAFNEVHDDSDCSIDVCTACGDYYSSSPSPEILRLFRENNPKGSVLPQHCNRCLGRLVLPVREALTEGTGMSSESRTATEDKVNKEVAAEISSWEEQRRLRRQDEDRAAVKSLQGFECKECGSTSPPTRTVERVYNGHDEERFLESNVVCCLNCKGRSEMPMPLYYVQLPCERYNKHWTSTGYVMLAYYARGVSEEDACWRAECMLPQFYDLDDSTTGSLLVEPLRPVVWPKPEKVEAKKMDRSNDVRKPMPQHGMTINTPSHKRWWLPDGFHQYNSVIYGDKHTMDILDKDGLCVATTYQVSFSNPNWKDLSDKHQELAKRQYARKK